MMRKVAYHHHTGIWHMAAMFITSPTKRYIHLMGILVKIHNGILGITLGFVLGCSWQAPTSVQGLVAGFIGVQGLGG